MQENPDSLLVRLHQVLAAIQGNLYILITQLDPDAMGAAVAFATALRYLKKTAGFVGDVRIAYCGRLGHAQNRAIFNSCNLGSQMFPIEQMVLEPDDRLALVDSSDVQDSRLPKGMLPISPVLVIDHHRSEGLPPEDETHFYWIEDGMGAASTLVVELLLAINAPISENLALLLTLGIYSDTKALASAHRRDRDAYGAMTKFVKPADLNRLLHYTLPKSHFKNLLYALSHQEQRGGRLVVGAGELAEEDGDDLSTIADYLLRCEGVSLVIVWGIIGKVVRISARTSDITIPLDKFLKDRFGPHCSGAKFTPDGRGEGGARLSLDLGIWMSPNVRAQAEALVSVRIQDLIFES